MSKTIQIERIATQIESDRQRFEVTLAKETALAQEHKTTDMKKAVALNKEERKPKAYQFDSLANYTNEVIYNRMVDLSEDLIFADPNAPTNAPVFRSIIEKEMNNKVRSKKRRKESIRRDIPQINLKLLPTKVMTERGVINALTPDKEVFLGLDDLNFMMLVGKPGTGKSVFLINILRQVRKLVIQGILKGQLATIDDKMGMFLSDSKNELQQECANIFDGIMVINEKTKELEPYLKLITPVEAVIDIKGKKTIIKPTNVDLVGNLSLNIAQQMFWQLLTAGEEGGNDPFWMDSANIRFTFTSTMNQFILKARRIKRTTSRLFINHIDTPLQQLKEVEECLARIKKLPLLEQELFFYDLFEATDYRANMWLNKLVPGNSAIAGNDIVKHMQAMKIMELAKAKVHGQHHNDSHILDEIEKSDEYDNLISFKIEDLLKHYGSPTEQQIKAMFSGEDLKHISQVAEYNKRHFIGQLRYARTTLVDTPDTTMGSIKGVLERVMKAITSNPVIGPWLDCEDGITGADCCTGTAIALYINRDEQPAFYDFAQRTLQSQYYNALRKRTGTWTNKASNVAKSLNPNQTRVIEITDEEYLTMNVELVSAIIAIIRSLGGCRLSATQYKTQYDEKLGGGDSMQTAVASNYFDIMLANTVMFDTNHETKRYISEFVGQASMNFTIGQNDVPTHIDKARLKNAIDSGYSGALYHKAYEDNIRYSHEKDGTPNNYDVRKEHPQAREFTLPPLGAVTAGMGNIFQVGQGNRPDEYDMANLINDEFTCFAAIRQGGVQQYGLCKMVTHFNQDKVYADANIRKFG